MNRSEFDFISGDDADQQREERLERDLSGVTKAIRSGISRYVLSEANRIEIPVSKEDIDAFNENRSLIENALDGWTVSPTSGFEYDRNVPIRVDMLRFRREHGDGSKMNNSPDLHFMSGAEADEEREYMMCQHLGYVQHVIGEGIETLLHSSDDVSYVRVPVSGHEIALFEHYTATVMNNFDGWEVTTGSYPDTRSHPDGDLYPLPYKDYFQIRHIT